MVNSKEEKQLMFTMVIDEKRSEALNAIFNAFHLLRTLVLSDREVSFDPLVELETSIKELENEFNKKHHKLGWCKDPTCTYKK